MLFAYRDARMSYERALELWDRVPDAAERSPVDRVDLLTRAAVTTGPSAPHRAAAYVRQAIDLVDPSIDAPRAGVLRAYLGATLLVRDDEPALAAAYEGFRLIPPEPPTAERARAGASLRRLDDSDR